MAGNALLALFVALAASSGARAQVPPPPPANAPTFDVTREIAGTWELSNSDRDRRCTITFSTDAAPGGLKLTLDQGCTTVFPMLKDVTVWSTASGSLRLMDPKGNAAIELSEVEDGLYEGERRGEGLFFMQPQAALAIPARTPDQMVGDWKFLREIDRPLCTLTFSTAPALDGLRLTIKPGCDAAIADFGLTTWQLEADQLVLTGRAGTWRFVESDTNIWERVPPSTNPLLMMKP
jgi:Protease inhibitor Inh